jgi:hypothetical protein
MPKASARPRIAVVARVIACRIAFIIVSLTFKFHREEYFDRAIFSLYGREMADALESFCREIRHFAMRMTGERECRS